MRTAALRARWGGRSGPRALAVQIFAGVVFPVVATGIASVSLFKSPASATNAAMLYLLSVCPYMHASERAPLYSPLR